MSFLPWRANLIFTGIILRKVCNLQLAILQTANCFLGGAKVHFFIEMGKKVLFPMLWLIDVPKCTPFVRILFPFFQSSEIIFGNIICHHGFFYKVSYRIRK